jgi:RIO kinase 1
MEPGRRRRAGQHKSPSGRPPAQDRARLTDLNDQESDFVPTYAAPLDPLHYERQWVIDSVGPFYQEGFVTDVTRLVKGGKEANVYCCLATPATGLELAAAKLYRPRVLRQLKNDAMYKAGRMLRDHEGKEIRGRREKLALSKKSDFGKELDTGMWIGNEFMTQTTLFQAGADVPRPLAQRGNTILMAYYGDEAMAAPTLSEIRLERGEAPALFDRVVANIRLMLAHHLVHSDLSAYNILYWEGQIAIIDFPQMVDARSNPHAPTLLERDVRRVCAYFERQGVRTGHEQLAADLWRSYMSGDRPAAGSPRQAR